MQGYIKLYRKLIDSPVWDDPNYLKLWMFCLMKATHKEREILIGNQVVTLEPGQFITGRKALSDELNRGMKTKHKQSEISWWRYLNNLEKWQMLNIKKTNKYSVVSITKWSEYQESEQQLNNNRTSNEQQLNTNKNVKNVENEKKKEVTTTAPENPVQLFEYILCRLSPIQMESLSQWIDDFKGNQEIVNAAIKLADKKNKRNFNFVEFLLKEWHSNNLMDIDRVRAYEREKFNSSKVKPFARKGKGIVRTEMLPDWFEENEQQSKPQPSDQPAVNDGEQMSEFERLMELRKNSGS
ncbi:DnaD domain protein [Cytobacillus sp. FSL W7-1323]|uniref:DnaD domain-containing protein n=1 Tax=Cytobacillus sp. FSL W7-1323 TaxID=2921700 RepID=UPI003158DC2E